MLWGSYTDSHISKPIAGPGVGRNDQSTIIGHRSRDSGAKVYSTRNLREPQIYCPVAQSRGVFMHRGFSKILKAV